MKQVVPAPQAKLCFFRGNRKEKTSSEANGVVANLFGRDPKPRGLRTGSRGALRRQGAGVVTSLPCPRETAAEREYRNCVQTASEEMQGMRSKKAARGFHDHRWKKREQEQADTRMASRRREVVAMPGQKRGMGPR